MRAWTTELTALAAFACTLLLALPAPAAEEALVVNRPGMQHTGDLPEMLERRLVRVLIAVSRTNFYLVKGQARGYEYELLKAYEKFLNKDVSRKKRAIRLLFIPTPFEQLIPALIAGEGDLAASNLTVTPQREELVAFSRSYLPEVSEIVVTAPDVGDIEQPADLSGRTFHVLRGSSYVQHLRELNVRLRTGGHRPFQITQVDRTLATEDILEMVNAGILELTVADSHIAELWSSVLGDMVLRPDLVVNEGGRIAWAIRKGNPKLKKSLDTFLRTAKKGTLLGNILFKRYFENTRRLTNPLAKAERAKRDRSLLVFKKYAAQYNIDWLLLMAQAYQESGLDHNKKSKRGAVGIMQMKPSTARDKNVAIADISSLENNVHAGAKYLAYLRDTYFNDEGMDPALRLDFAIAGYNAGPARVKRLRAKAKAQGLDPDRWFDNVELVALKEIGQETVRYVANIHKYYLAYKLAAQSLEARARELEALQERRAQRDADAAGCCGRFGEVRAGMPEAPPLPTG